MRNRKPEMYTSYTSNKLLNRFRISIKLKLSKDQSDLNLVTDIYLILEQKSYSEISVLMKGLPKDERLGLLTMVCLKVSISRIVKNGSELCLLRDISQRLDKYHIGGGNYRVKPDPANEFLLQAVSDIWKIKCIIKEYFRNEDEDL